MLPPSTHTSLLHTHSRYRAVFILLPLPTPTPLTAVQLKMCSSFQVHSLYFTLSFLPPHMWSLCMVSGDFFLKLEMWKYEIILELPFTPQRSLKIVSTYSNVWVKCLVSRMLYRCTHDSTGQRVRLGKLYREGRVVSQSNLPPLCPIWHATAR